MSFMGITWKASTNTVQYSVKPLDSLISKWACALPGKPVVCACCFPSNDIRKNYVSNTS